MANRDVVGDTAGAPQQELKPPTLQEFMASLNALIGEYVSVGKGKGDIKLCAAKFLEVQASYMMALDRASLPQGRAPEERQKLLAEYYEARIAWERGDMVNLAIVADKLASHIGSEP